MRAPGRRCAPGRKGRLRSIDRSARVVPGTVGHAGEQTTVPWVVPPPWASSRIKLDQLFYKDGINPPADLIESASFLTALTFIQQRGAIAFWARSVALHFRHRG